MVCTAVLLGSCVRQAMTVADVFSTAAEAPSTQRQPLFLLIEAGGRRPPPPAIIFDDGSTDFGSSLSPRALKALANAIASSQWETLGKKDKAYCDSWADGRDEAYGAPQKYADRVFKPCDTAFAADDELLALARIIRAARAPKTP